MKHLRSLFLLCAFTSLVACSGGDDGGDCAAGSAKCACLPSGGCSEGLACLSGVCAANECAPGTDGCACLEGQCGQSTNGDPLSCRDGVCQVEGCAAGQPSCACRMGTECTTGAACVDSVCQAQSCIPGGLGCECLAGGCDRGLTCSNNVCADQKGRVGGACKDDGTCNQNARCDKNTVPATCVYCDLGTFACQCDANAGCQPGLSCVNGHCAGDETIQNRVPPENPTCYTPCSDDIVNDDGTVRECSSEGLMVGCLDNLTCVEGSCVPPNGQRRMCFADADCPDFQQCMQGYCYSQCDNDAACPNGEACHMTVCRPSCVVGAGTCPSGTYCGDSPNNANGYCLPTTRTSTRSGGQPQEGTVEVTRGELTFSNITLSQSFTLINRSDRAQSFDITKVSHELRSADGTVERKIGSDTCQSTDCPMWWLSVTAPGEEASRARSTRVRVNANCEFDNSCPTITVGADSVTAVSWSGLITVTSPLGSSSITVSFRRRPEGRWRGQMVYFSNFSDAGIDSRNGRIGWLDRPREHVDRRNSNDLDVQNGLIRRWGAFRTGRMDNWGEMTAVLRATESEQWRWPSVRENCAAFGGACYLYASDTGSSTLNRTYVSDTNATPIPAGSSTFPMAMNLYAPDPMQPGILSGRVVSDVALHYPGDPQIELRFETDPTQPNTACDGDVTSNCVTFLQGSTNSSEPEGLTLELAVGGRYEKGSASCAAGYTEQAIPWLVPGFLDGAEPAGTFYQRRWCVDSRLPDYSSPVSQIAPEVQVANRSLARGNPIPNGKILRRRMQLLDGAMIDQTQIFILFRETYPSFLDGGDQIDAYGYMVLEREDTEISLEDADKIPGPDEFQGSVPPAQLSEGSVVSASQCSTEILNELNIGSVNASNVGMVVASLIDGGASQGPALAIPPGNATACTGGSVEVHYLCEETGLFNGGATNTACWGSGLAANGNTCGSANNGVCEDGGAGSTGSGCAIGTDAADCGPRYVDARTACPMTSSVVFFTADVGRHAEITGHACQDTGTCSSVLRQWTESGSAIITQLNPVWSCTNGMGSCDDNAFDRRSGKTFYAADTTGVHFTALRPAIADAFRYRTRFVNREGTSLGFTPSVCEPFSTTIPYCYDPVAIERIKARVDCLLHVYENHSGSLTSLQAQRLYDYLAENFARFTPLVTSNELPRAGFEQYYAELLIMLGDQSFTNAFESRYDLAGLGNRGFPGDQFEQPDGLSVSGIAGSEMFTLHQAVQYYTLALDRFYGQSGSISEALDAGATGTPRNFLSAETVTTYFDRLIRASTQRSRAWAEIARRYQAFNRPNLARRVATRAFNATYLESIALANIIRDVIEREGGASRAQLLIALEDAQRRYSMALLDLGNVYRTITDDVNILGFEPDYIPFPALDNSGTNADINAFERIYQRAQFKMDTARTREQLASAQTREFDTDEASFQAELTRLARTYETQLGEVCGTFVGVDNQVHPAIEQRAYLSDVYSLYGDPCGFVGNGTIHEKIVQMDIARIELKRISVEMANVLERVAFQEERVAEVCRIQADISNYNLRTAEETFRMDEEIRVSEFALEQFKHVTGTGARIAEMAICDPLKTCIQAGVAAAAIAGLAAAETIASTAQNVFAANRRDKKAKMERAAAQWVELQQCEIAEAELLAETKTIMLSLSELQLSGYAAQLQVGLALSEISKARNEAKRIQLEMAEALQLAVNVQAARNNPNIRIYRNDAVLNAEVAFEDALREAYKLTLVYEYYTSQSYAQKDQLLLIRMVSAGDYNLENYVFELRNAFLAFEETFGNPDVRVMKISLRDDILDLPRVGPDGRSYGNNERIALLRAALTDPDRLNEDGYITIPFATRLQSVSPVTRNHKVLYVEANLRGDDIGDHLARIYLRQRGTSTVRTLMDGRNFYRFPNRTAVIDPWVNSTRQDPSIAGSQEIFRSYRLRDLPLINDNWELIFNNRDEAVNADIPVDRINDIVLYVFYTDFTAY